MKVFRLVIVGGGPSCTYVLERLAATAPHVREPFGIDIHVFEKSGEFGSGEVHSPKQAPSSFLNRIAGQVGFGADESVEGAGPLLPREKRPTLYEWCRIKFAETGDPAFAVKAESWPQRRVHGLALQEAFQIYASMLRAHKSVRVFLHEAEVIDVCEDTDGFRVVATGVGEQAFRADHVLFLTGHSHSDPRSCNELKPLVDFAERSGATYVPYAYPLEHIPQKATGPGKIVGTSGMGLTALDVILYLTEGRGGRFERDSPSGHLLYAASGLEPCSIVPFGNSGLFTFARPFNAKEKDPPKLEHKPVFLTEAAIERLRQSVGKPIEVAPFGVRRQLDYEHDVHPLVLLEMAIVYYATLLGDDFGEFIELRVRPAYEAFLNGKAGLATAQQAAAMLLGPVDAAVSEAFALIARVLGGRVRAGDAGEGKYAWSVEAAVKRYLFVVFGDMPSSRDTSRWGHSIDAEGNRFSWDLMIRPITAEQCSSSDKYLAALKSFMDRDHLWAIQDNIHNPAKAAADGVWRDLRQVLAHAVDFGGLTADSHRTFLTVYMHHHNRLANGAALEVMEKIRALIDHGLVDASVGPQPKVEPDAVSGRFVVRGLVTGATRQLDTLIDAKVHAFNPEMDCSPLYRNMLRRGLIQKWRNPAHDGSCFEPGGLALSMDFHPIRTNGQAEPRFTFLGPPSEGVMFFQLGAFRPNQNHHVMRDIVRWIEQLWMAVAAHRACDQYADSYAKRAVQTSQINP